MREDRQHCLQILHRPLGTARQVDDQCPPADASHGAGEHGVRRLLQTFGAHGFGKTGRFALDHLSGGFGGYVTWGKACAACGEDHIHFAAVCPLAQRRADGGFIVGENRLFGRLTSPGRGSNPPARDRKRQPVPLSRSGRRGSKSQIANSRRIPCRRCFSSLISDQPRFS